MVSYRVGTDRAQFITDVGAVQRKNPGDAGDGPAVGWPRRPVDSDTRYVPEGRDGESS